MPEITLLAQMLALLLAIGAFAGIIAGLLGVGGGIILVPAFFYAFSVLGHDSPYLMQICLATSLATIIVTSLRSVSAHHRSGAVDWQVLRRWAPGVALGALAGVLVAAALRTAALQAVFGVLAMIVGLFFAFGRPDWRLGAQMPGRPLSAALSLAVGCLSVLVGIGGGAFGVPIMTLFGMPIHRAVATASGFGVLIAAPSVLAFMALVSIPEPARPPFTIGAVNLPAFAAIVAMTFLTAPIGARLSHAADPRLLRRIFAVFVLLMALNMLRKAVF